MLYYVTYLFAQWNFAKGGEQQIQEGFLKKLGLPLGLSSRSPRKKRHHFQEMENVIEVGMNKL